MHKGCCAQNLSALCTDSPPDASTAVSLATTSVTVTTGSLATAGLTVSTSSLATAGLIIATSSIATGITSSQATADLTIATSPLVTPSGSVSPAASDRSTISTSSVLSEDPYREKIEALKLEVERLQRLILDERTENARLRQQQAEQPRVVKRCGKDDNMELAQAMDVQSSSMSRTDQQMLEQLQADKQKLQAEVARLRLTQASPTEKDREITRLNQRNTELTESMAEQTSDLKTRLQQTANMCQQLAGQLDQSQTGHRLQEVAKNFNQLQVNGNEGRPEVLRHENDQLKDQVTTLNQHLQEVVELNTRWQVYDRQREEYLSTLKEKLKVTEDKLASDRPLQLSEQQQAEVDRIILQYKHKVDATEEEKLKLSDENRELRLKLDRSMAEKMELETVVKSMEHKMQSQPVSGGSRQDAERIQVLEHQIQLCTEDFESERRDRERAQSKIEEMEQELRIVHRQLDQFQGRQMEEIAARRQAALQYYRDEYERTHPGYQNVALVGRGGLIEADGPDDDTVEDGDGCDTVDFGPVDPVRQFQQAESALHRVHAEDTLQCPKCRKEFPISQHEKLLEHTEDCI